MKRIIRNMFFFSVELLFLITVLKLVLPSSFLGQDLRFSNWIYYLGAFLAMIVPIRHFAGKGNKEWPWIVAYYQLVSLIPIVFLSYYILS